MLAAYTTIPVMGVPVESKALKGMDSLLSIVQMPAGVPVASFAIGHAGATNAGLMAASIVAVADDDLSKRLKAWRQNQTDAIADSPVDDN
jgi:5-(carboxyamino)imidazole ribonucleotide mutase